MRAFETLEAVLRGGFVPGRGLRGERSRNLFLRREVLHPPEGNVPSINMDNRLLIGVRSKCYNFLAIQLDY